ncbi:hypothetical protein [Streptomyces mirabilis]|uniref:hypothetical protein n=1 Tax=Streptomyces mirabilis TaxID=68239 RepID=UPI003D9E275C
MVTSANVGDRAAAQVLLHQVADAHHLLALVAMRTDMRWRSRIPCPRCLSSPARDTGLGRHRS